MDKEFGRILRKDEVKFEGRRKLALLKASEPRQSGDMVAPAEAGVQRSARIVENNPDFAVIEISCCCGERTYLRCEYAGSHVSD